MFLISSTDICVYLSVKDIFCISADKETCFQSCCKNSVQFSSFIRLCLTLCDPMDCSPPGSSVHGILQAIMLKWVVVLSSRGSSPSRDRTHISCGSHIVGGFFTTKPLGKPQKCMYVYIYIYIYIFLI